MAVPTKRAIQSFSAAAVAVVLVSCGGGDETVSVSPPTISAGPVEVTVFTGQTATFSVAAQGTGVTYQWLRNGTPISGATAAQYTTSPASLDDQGALFTVSVSNTAGSAVSSAAALRVVPGDATTRGNVARAVFNVLSVYAPATAPLFAVSADTSVVGALSGACTSGSVTATLNGAVPSAGSLLSSGNSTLQATFADCELQPRLVVGGTVSNAVNAPATPLVGSASWTIDATLTAARTRLSAAASGAPAEADFTGNGALRIALTQVRDATTLTDTAVFTPGSGFSVADALRSTSASFAGGELRDALTFSYVGGRSKLQSQAVRITATTYTVQSIPYSASGEASLTYGTDGAITASAGSIEVRSGPLTVAQIRATSSGFVVDIDGATTPLAVFSQR